MRYSVICLIFTLVSSINLLFTSADLKNYLRVIHDSHSSKISRYLRNSPGLCGDCSSNLWMDDYFLVMEITVLAKFSDTRGNYGHLFLCDSDSLCRKYTDLYLASAALFPIAFTNVSRPICRPGYVACSWSCNVYSWKWSVARNDKVHIHGSIVSDLV